MNDWTALLHQNITWFFFKNADAVMPWKFKVLIFLKKIKA